MGKDKKAKDLKNGKNSAPAIDNDQLGENISVDPDAWKSGGNVKPGKKM